MLNTSDDQVEDLQARILATRWPEEELTTGSQGVPLDVVKDLAHCWATEYD